MKKSLIFVCLFLAATMFVHPGATLAIESQKPHDHLRTHEAWDQRDGGETIADAIEIELPYSDSGATCDNIDDYDEVCPYSGSTSPDVVYTFIATLSEGIMVDLCGSTYDTKVYVYDSSLNVVGCNDDFYTDDGCGTYVSYLDQVPVIEGERYYVVIDGYGGDCGEFIVQIGIDCQTPPCLDAQCLPGSESELEANLFDGYVDTFNSGCNVDPPAFQELIMPWDQDELNFCGQTGWYTTDSVLQRDEDWFILMARSDNIHVETNSSFWMSTDCDVLILQDCENVSLLPFQMGVCESGMMDIPTQIGDIVFLRVRPTLDGPEECSHRQDLYTLKITGIDYGIVATDSMPWDAVKSLYR